MSIDYNNVKKYWNSDINHKFRSQFSLGYKIEDEFVAYYRFLKELDFLNKKAIFKGNYLDLGCGAGNFLFEWGDRFSNLIGIDISAVMVDFAKSKCKNSRNIFVYKDDILNFDKYIVDETNFVFIGGCLMYLNDNDCILLLKNLFLKLENGGVLIFRESVFYKNVVEKDDGYEVIRRELSEYLGMVNLLPNNSVKIYRNYAYNYVNLISIYLKILPFLRNKIFILKNPIFEFIFLFVPLSLISFIKKDVMMNYFFVIKKNG